MALLETNSKGVRDHVDYVKRLSVAMPDVSKELKNSIEDGLVRKPGWKSLIKVRDWLAN